MQIVQIICNISKYENKNSILLTSSCKYLVNSINPSFMLISENVNIYAFSLADRQNRMLNRICYIFII